VKVSKCLYVLGCVLHLCCISACGPVRTSRSGISSQSSKVCVQAGVEARGGFPPSTACTDRGIQQAKALTGLAPRSVSTGTSVGKHSHWGWHHRWQ